MLNKKLLNKIFEGDCIEILNTKIPPKSIDLIFADPPYNLQLKNELWRPNQTKVNAVNDDWDKFSSFEEYDRFSYKWLKSCKRVMKDNATIWVIGSYHNIFRIGKIMQDLGFWILNDVVWIKTNPMPNFNGTRFTNAHETLIWAKKSEKQKQYIFHYQMMKSMNDDKQMRSDWYLPICNGKERIKINGEKAHTTQKPEALLRRIILSSSNMDDVILDPFFGSGTTGVVAKQLKRNFIGIEREKKYIKIAKQRLKNTVIPLFPEEMFVYPERRNLAKVLFINLLEKKMLQIGDNLYSKNKEHVAKITVDGSLIVKGFRGSIHKTAAYLLQKQSSNGWLYWYYLNKDGQLISIDTLRDEYRKRYFN